MKREICLCLFALATVLNSVAGEVIFSDTFETDAVWTEKKNVTPRELSVTFGGAFRGKSPCLVLHGTATNRRDTAWLIRTKPRPVPPGNRSYRLKFEAAADMEVSSGGMEGADWYTGVGWFDASGKAIRFDQIRYVLGDCEGFARILHGKDIPDGAASFAVQFGMDWPNVWGGHRVAFRNVGMDVTPDVIAPPPPRALPDSRPPRVILRNHSPLPDAKEEIVFSVIDPSGVRDGVSLMVDGRDATGDCVRKNDTYRLKPPAGAWATGLHTAVVSAVDHLGHATKATRYFAVCEPPRAPTACLRSDGQVLIDGVPFFPIGVYSLQKTEANSNSYDVAFAQLRAAGMNLAQRYGRPPEDFLDAAARHGCKTFVRPWPNDGEFFTKRRHHPAILAWYLADDTARHFTPEQLAADDSFFKAADDRHLTAQADEVGSFSPVTGYYDYVPYADVFLPEIYPIRKNRPNDAAETCVPEVVTDMKCSRRDARAASPDRPRSIWAILPHFFTKNQCWHRYPTQKELRAMTFAALCNGANGITYYTYKLGGGKIVPDEGGAINTPESWAVLTNVTTEVAALGGLLCAADAEKAGVEILEGPAKDVFENDSISSVVRHWHGEEWIIAVNSTLKRVMAQFTTRTGSRVETFDGYGVKVLRRPLKGAPARCEPGFVPLFNGKDLTGWQGATDSCCLTNVFWRNVRIKEL